MTSGHLNTVLSHLRRLTRARQVDGLSDGRLLERFAVGQDEAAFAAILERHGPMVLGVCRRLLRNAADADDAFQATFLVLVARAGTITRRDSVGSWLYGVAYRTAHRARERAARHRLLDRPAELPAPAREEPAAVLARQELRPLLDQELQRLPEKYRAPLVLCYLEGRTNAEAAAQLGWPLGTVQVRLFRARELLRTRLVRRGVTLSVGLLAGGVAPDACAVVPAALAATSLRAAVLFAAGLTATAVPVQVAALTRGVLRTMLLAKLQTITVALVAMAVFGVSAGLAAQHLLAGKEAAVNEILTPPAAAPKLAAVAEVLPEPDAAPENPDRPRVVQVHPADGATDVEPVTEIRLRFDRPMDRTSGRLFWAHGRLPGFRLRDPMRYVEATREFILPVELSPGQKHEVTANQEVAVSATERNYEGFQSEGRVVAKWFPWSFTTKKPAAKPGNAPRVTSVGPPSETEVALLIPLEVTFDQPMDPRAYGMVAPGSEDLGGMLPDLVAPPEYDAGRRRFTLLTPLRPNWNGELRLEGFRSQDGVEAAPATVKYRTLRTRVAESLRNRVEQAGRSPELRQLVERVRKARRDLTSVTEEAVLTTAWRHSSPGWYREFDTTGSRFQVQGDKFLGVVDGNMHMPFRVGSDGTTFWLRRGNERIVLPAKDVAEKNLLFCDAFDAAGTGDAVQVIRKQNLEYLGEAVVCGRRSYRVRSWDIAFAPGGWPSPVREWSIDAATLLPVRIEMMSQVACSIDYTHTRVNQPIPDEEFRPDAGPDIKVIAPEPLTEGYTRRFLTVIDGCNGRMSVRWGMKGPKGTSSSGLN